MMKVWFVLLILALCAAAYDPRKMDRKDPESEEDDADLPSLPTSEEDEDSREYVAKLENTKKSKDSKKGKKTSAMRTIDVNELFDLAKVHRISKIKEEMGNSTDTSKLDAEYDYDDDDSQMYRACQNDVNEMCHCEMKTMNCVSIVVDSEDPKLRTTNLEVSSDGKPFEVEKAIFSHNGLRGLRANKIVPTHEKEIKVLDFGFNEIRTIDDGTFEKFKQLTKLNLENNLLKTVKKSWFTGIGDTLHKLDLTHNGLKNLPKGVFSELKNLKTLVLDQNTFTKLEKEMFRGLDSLETLSLDGCLLQSLPDDLFEYLPKLTGVSLEGNKFDEVPKVLKDRKLKNIDLSETLIVELREKAFGDNDNLETVRMTHSVALGSVRDCAFCGLPSLQTVELSNSSIVEFHQNAFGNHEPKDGMKVAQPTSIDLSGNKLTTLSEDLLDWDHVEDIKVGGNPFSCDCSTLFLLEGEAFHFKQETMVPRCSGPNELNGRNIASLSRKEMCPTAAAKGDKVQKSSQIFVILLLFVFASIGIYYLVSSGKVQRFMRKDWSTQQVTYSNLNREDGDNVNLQGDFNPRLAEV